MHERKPIVVAVVASTLVAVLGATACTTGNPPPGDQAYKSGSLGQGGFLFGCKDGVACSRWSTGAAKDFPSDGVALGSTFNIRFVPNDEQNQPVDIFSTAPTADGITVKGLLPFFSGGPDGIAATDRAGWGAIVAQEPNGTVVDFIALEVVKPTTFTIYDADSTNEDPTDVGDALTLKKGDTKRFRTVGKGSDSQPLAGSITVDWKSSDTSSVIVDNVTDGVATVVAEQATTSAKLTLVGGGFTRSLAITVTP